MRKQINYFSEILPNLVEWKLHEKIIG